MELIIVSLAGTYSINDKLAEKGGFQRYIRSWDGTKLKIKWIVLVLSMCSLSMAGADCNRKRCPSNNKPICARDNNDRLTFVNSCYLRAYNCENKFSKKFIWNTICPLAPHILKFMSDFIFIHTDFIKVRDGVCPAPFQHSIGSIGIHTPRHTPPKELTMIKFP